MTVMAPKVSGTDFKAALLPSSDLEGPNLPHTEHGPVKYLAIGVVVTTLTILAFLVPVATYVTLQVVSLSARVDHLEQVIGISGNTRVGLHGPHERLVHPDNQGVEPEVGDDGDDDDDDWLGNLGDYENDSDDDDYDDHYDEDDINISDPAEEEEGPTGYVWRDAVRHRRHRRGTGGNEKGKSVTCQIKTNSKSKKLLFDGSNKERKICYATINKYISARIEKKLPMTAIHLKSSVPVDGKTMRWLNEDQNRFKNYPEQDGQMNAIGFLPNRQRMAFWAPADWSDTSKIRKSYIFNQLEGSIQVQKSGLYFIYAQVHFHETQANLGYYVQREGQDDERLFSCYTNIEPLPPQAGEPVNMSAADLALRQTCSLTGTVHLEKDDTLSLRQSGQTPDTIDADSDATYWGVVHLSAG